MYCLAKLFSYTDEDYLGKYRLLGPFALIVPGVLKPGGAKYLMGFLVVTAALFLFALYAFEFDTLGFS